MVDVAGAPSAKGSGGRSMTNEDGPGLPGVPGLPGLPGLPGAPPQQATEAPYRGPLRPLPGFAGAAPKRAPKPPGVTAVVISALALAFALLLGVLAIGFFAVAARDRAEQPARQAELDRLWNQPGNALSGDAGSVDLVRQQEYEVYLEVDANALAKGRDIPSVDVTVSGPDGEVLNARSRFGWQASFTHAGRALVAEARFLARTGGRYQVKVTAHGKAPVDARVKVGPSPGSVTGDKATLGRNLGIATLVIMAIVAALGVRGIVRFRKRRQSYRRSVERHFAEQAAQWSAGGIAPPPSMSPPMSPPMPPPMSPPMPGSSQL